MKSKVDGSQGYVENLHWASVEDAIRGFVVLHDIDVQDTYLNFYHLKKKLGHRFFRKDYNSFFVLLVKHYYSLKKNIPINMISKEIDMYDLLDDLNRFEENFRKYLSEELKISDNKYRDNSKTILASLSNDLTIG